MDLEDLEPIRLRHETLAEPRVMLADLIVAVLDTPGSATWPR